MRTLRPVAAGSALVIADSPDRGGFIEGKAMPVHIGSMIGAVPEGVIAMGKVAAATPTSHVMKGFRWEKPDLAVGASGGGGRYESYDRVLEVPGLNDIGAARLAAARGRAGSRRLRQGYGRSGSSPPCRRGKTSFGPVLRPHFVMRLQPASNACM